MKLVRKIEITDSTLGSTTAVETVALYNAGTTYALGAQARSDTTHRIYESLAAGNVGNALTDTTKWLDIGPTNVWAMFDDMNSSQTVAASTLSVEFSPGERLDHIGLINITATSAQVTAEHATDGVVFDETFDLVSTSGIVDWYTYFTEPIEVETDFIVDGLPALYADLTITVSLSYPGQTVRCGSLVAGVAKILGDTEFGFTTGIIDRSKKDEDVYGNISILERGYSNKASFSVTLDNANVVSVQRLLGDYRGKAALYIGTGRYSNTFLYGLFRDFSIVVQTPVQATLAIECENLI